MVKRRTGRLGKLRDRLVTPASQATQRLTSELRAPGEVGRAIPGQVQAQFAAQEQATKPVGTPDIPAATGRTEISTYFTKVGGNHLLYQAESWVRVRLMVETAGPVAIGSRDDVEPVLSGKGIRLPTDIEIPFSLAKGNRVFITATAVSRVRFIVEPIPWAEQIAIMIGSLLSLGRR